MANYGYSVSLEAIDYMPPYRCTYLSCDAAILASAGYVTFSYHWRAGAQSI
jgi:hypothetical protein